jgi:hypothetical protein
MLSRTIAAAALALCLAAPAGAQDAAAPPPVESMDCTAMTAELMTAGRQMSSQVDLAGMQADSQATQDDIARRRPAGSEGAVTAEEARARQQRQHDRVQNAMAGLDQNRLMALMTRFEQQRCPTPQ